MKESKAMVAKEMAFMKKKGAPKSMIKHEKAEAKGKPFAKGGCAMAKGGGIMMKNNPEMVGGMGGNKQPIGGIMRGNSPDKAAAMRALMQAKTSPVNSDDFVGRNPKPASFGQAAGMLGMMRGLKQSATSGGAPALQPKKPDITAAGPNAMSGAMKKGGKVMKKSGCSKMATGGIANANRAKGDISGKLFKASAGEGIEKGYKANTKAVKHRQGDGCAQRGLTKIGRSKEM